MKTVTLMTTEHDLGFPKAFVNQEVAIEYLKKHFPEEEMECTAEEYLNDLVWFDTVRIIYDDL